MYISPLGNIYGVILSMMILCQINASQYILIRIPLMQNIFITKAQINIKSSLLSKLITEADKDEQIKDNKFMRSMTKINRKDEEFRL